MGSFSSSNTLQQDLRTLIDGNTGIVATPESILSMPGSTAIGDATLSHGSNWSFNQDFTPEVAGAIAAIIDSSQDTISRVIGLTDSAMDGIFAAQENLSEQVDETRLGESSVFTKYLPYAILGVFVILFMTRK